jgi:lysyl-tRNA synthetase class I
MASDPNDFKNLYGISFQTSIKQVEKGVIICKGRSIPAIVVQASTAQRAREKFKLAINFYLNTFPKEIKRLIEERGKEIKDSSDKKQTDEKIESQDDYMDQLQKEYDMT